MVDEKVRLIMGSLLHDTGKVIYRKGDDRRNHSISGYDYLKEETNLTDSEILDCVRYHHASLLKRAVGLKENSLAYIIWLIILRHFPTGGKKMKAKIEVLNVRFRCRVYSIF